MTDTLLAVTATLAANKIEDMPSDAKVAEVLKQSFCGAMEEWFRTPGPQMLAAGCVVTAEWLRKQKRNLEALNIEHEAQFFFELQKGNVGGALAASNALEGQPRVLVFKVWEEACADMKRDPTTGKPL